MNHTGTGFSRFCKHNRHAVGIDRVTIDMNTEHLQTQIKIFMNSNRNGSFVQ